MIKKVYTYLTHLKVLKTHHLKVRNTKGFHKKLTKTVRLFSHSKWGKNGATWGNKGDVFFWRKHLLYELFLYFLLSPIIIPFIYLFILFCSLTFMICFDSISCWFTFLLFLCLICMKTWTSMMKENFVLIY